ncbi:MAG: thiamine phosphate synthase, partial [Gemmatimonadetes bacterium]|nr:thiamine phosphate synthase [Gemmatimonadota bacterium]
MTLARLADSLRLVVITDEALARPRSVPDVVASAVTAGAPAVQLRAKGASARELHAAGLELLPIVRDGGALFFVNDRVDVALALGADGVHLGPDDLPVAAARRAAQTAGR